MKKLKRGRPPVHTKCGWCGKELTLTQMREHQPHCPKRPGKVREES